MKVPAHGTGYMPETKDLKTITLAMPTETKRPIGFAAWSTADEKPNRKRTPKKAA